MSDNQVIDQAIPESIEAPESIETISHDSTSVDAPISDKEATKIEAKADAGKKLTKEEKVQLKEYKLKVNGKEKVVRFDPHNEQEVIKYLERAEGSDQKFKEAADVRNAALRFIEELKKNPRKVLSDPNIGVDVRKFAEEIMNEALADAEKSPEQREIEKLQKKLEEINKQKEEDEKTAAEKNAELLRSHYEQEFTTQINSALDVGGLPKTARTVNDMAHLMSVALAEGVDLSFQDLAPIVKNNTSQALQEIIKSMSDDQLEDFIGKDIIGRLRKRNVAKAKAAAAIPSVAAVKNTGAEVQKEEKKPVKKQTIREFLRV